MKHKRQTLNLLKHKVNLMQKDLKVYEKRQPKVADLPDLLKPVNKITHIKKKSNFSQTHRDIAFSFRDSDSFFYKEPSQGQTGRSQDKTNTERSISPALKDISNRIDTQYYLRKSKECQKKYETQGSGQMCQTSFIGRRYAFNEFGLSRTQVFSPGKLKTYDMKRTDTVLNPQSEKEKGKKIVKKLDRSPDQMLQENPNSNTKLYIFDDKPVYLWKKKSTNEKNKSSLVNSKSKGHIMPSKDSSLQKKSVSHRKHFQKYIQDIYCGAVPRPLETH